MTERTPGRRTPVGNSENLNVLPLATTVWPALAPPLKRTTKSCRSVRRSTILPLASSPHWRPTTQVPGMRGSRLPPPPALGVEHKKCPGPRRPRAARCVDPPISPYFLTAAPEDRQGEPPDLSKTARAPESLRRRPPYNRYHH